MIRFAMALVAALATTPALASDLVLHEVLSEQPLSDATDMKVVIERVTVKPGGEIARHVHPGDAHLVVLEGGTVTLADGSEASYAAGDVMFHSAGEAHGGITNAGDSDIVMMVTYVVNVLEPFSWPVE